MEWEYFTEKHEPGGWVGGKVDLSALSGSLNRLGAQGWELVSAFDTNINQGATREVILIFKRPRRKA